MTNDQKKTKSTAKELRTHEASTDSDYYARMVKGLPQIVFEMNLEGTYTFANDCALKAFGYTNEDLQHGLTIQDIMHPDSLARAKANINSVIQGNSPTGGEYLGQRKDGSTFPIKIFPG